MNDSKDRLVLRVHDGAVPILVHLSLNSFSDALQHLQLVFCGAILLTEMFAQLISIKTSVEIDYRSANRTAALNSLSLLCIMAVPVQLQFNDLVTHARVE